MGLRALSAYLRVMSDEDARRDYIADMLLVIAQGKRLKDDAPRMRDAYPHKPTLVDARSGGEIKNDIQRQLERIINGGGAHGAV